MTHWRTVGFLVANSHSSNSCSPSVCQSVSLSVCLSVSLSVCQSVCLSVTRCDISSPLRECLIFFLELLYATDAPGDLSGLVKCLLWSAVKTAWLCLFTININSSYMMGKLSPMRIIRWRTTPSGFHFMIDDKTSSSVEILNMKDLGTLSVISFRASLGK